MKIKYVVKVDEVRDIQPAVKQDESGKTIPKIASDGSPVFAMLCLFKTKQKIGLKEVDAFEEGKLDSTIEFEIGAKDLLLECEQYVMSNRGTPSLHYRAVKIFKPEE